MASWLWGNETTEQAQIVVSALQGELDERDGKIKALEAALRREQQELSRVVADEISALEQRKARIEAELSEVNALLEEKQALLKSGGKKEKKSKKKKVTAAKEAEAVAEKKPKTPAAAAEAEAPAPKPKKSKTPAADADSDAAPSKSKKSKAPAADAAGDTEAPKPKKLPMDKHLKKIAKVEPNVAFIIQRSTNSNTVVYAAGLTADKQLDSAKPLDVYWIMYEKSGAPREDLNMIERNTAYGVSCSPSKTRGQFAASIASLKDRECTLLIDEHGNVQARTVINGKKGMVLRRVYVQMTSSWGIPAVDYIEIFGVDPATHEPVYEKKSNK